MLRRLILLLSTLILTCALGLTVTSANGLPGVQAAGNAVGADPTVATAMNGACKAFAASRGTTNRNARSCTTKPSLSASADCTAGRLTFTGSNLIPGSVVWFYSAHENTYLIVTTVAPDGTLNFSIPGFFTDTITLGAYAAGADPNQGAVPYYTAKPYSFHCAIP